MNDQVKFERFERIVDSLATISDIIYNRTKCWECEPCWPGGDPWLTSLKTLVEAGKVRTAGAASKQVGDK